jgi:hypothetical protein
LQQSGRVRRRALSVAGFRCSTRNTAVELGVGELTPRLHPRPRRSTHAPKR